MIMVEGSTVYLYIDRARGWTDSLFFIFTLIFFPLDSSYIIKRNFSLPQPHFPIVICVNFKVLLLYFFVYVLTINVAHYRHKLLCCNYKLTLNIALKHKKELVKIL